ncbi:MAG: hypothetical protein JKY65_00975 [Planctomycetes bacterium]|nr:hypothetical protein [Planctomycetota bacterium]
MDDATRPPAPNDPPGAGRLGDADDVTYLGPDATLPAEATRFGDDVTYLDQGAAPPAEATRFGDDVTYLDQGAAPPAEGRATPDQTQWSGDGSGAQPAVGSVVLRPGA